MFHIGQEVVCVDDSWKHMNWEYVPNRPIKGKTYQIRGIQTGNNETRLVLEEIINPVFSWSPPWGLSEGSFPSNRFRPIQKKTTDISSLIALLNPANHKKLEDA